MMKLTRALGIILLFLGCSALPAAAENTVILPSIDVTTENIGKGQIIALHIVDQRADKTLGFDIKDDEKVPIPSTQDITQIIYYQMIEALKAKGFVVDNGAGPQVPSLTIQIKALNYTLRKNFFTKVLNITTDLRAVVARDGGTLSKGYQLEKKMQDFILSGSNQEQKRMTKTISVALTDMANDHMVLNALATKMTPAAPGTETPETPQVPAGNGPIEQQALPPN